MLISKIIWEKEQTPLAVSDSIFWPDKRISVRFLRDAAGVRVDNWQLRIAAMRPKDAGQYTCRIAGRKGQSVTTRATVQETKFEPFFVYSTKPIMEIKVDPVKFVGDPLNLTCSIPISRDENSEQRISLEWLKADPIKSVSMRLETMTPLQNYEITNQVRTVNDTLSLYEAIHQLDRSTEADATAYQCRAYTLDARSNAKIVDCAFINLQLRKPGEEKLLGMRNEVVAPLMANLINRTLDGYNILHQRWHAGKPARSDYQLNDESRVRGE
ncbi:hypothetical protein Ciccas_011353 [Cichlidogyrus casuarinus]|uniref:Ig-like domain-containing protein n=1 Tax=Cichlidogyrus casuarinus TaxID=1844966 RepID=A0ABD2PT57_9PLAT